MNDRESNESKEKKLFNLLDELSITHHTYRHPAVLTVTEAQTHRPSPLPKGSIFLKNLFLRNKKEQMFLVVLEESRPVDLKSLGEACGATRHVSFASQDRLFEYLGVLPGSVTPFAVVNDLAGKVKVILDQAIFRNETEWVHAHPLHCEATTMISPNDLLRFLGQTKHEPTIIDLD